MTKEDGLKMQEAIESRINVSNDKLRAELRADLENLRMAARKDIEDLNQHMTDLFSRYMDNHYHTHDQIEVRLQSLESRSA